MMKVRWSQLVYRRPGSDNAAGLSRLYDSSKGVVCRFDEDPLDIESKAEGYLALVPLSVGIEEEIDMWVEIDDEESLARDHSLWNDGAQERERGHFLSSLRLRINQWFSPRATH